MLVIAIPKSASTSLLATLANIYDLQPEQEFFPDQPMPDLYRLLPKYHSDMRLITEEQAERWAGRNRLFKQHIPPSPANVEKLKRLKKVVLLRDPGEIVLAYRRAELAQIHASRPEFQACTTEQEWLRKANENGLMEDLRRWYGGWLNDSSLTLYIHYGEIVIDPGRVINSIAEFWGLSPVAANVSLAQKRYSRRSRTVRKVRGVLRRMARLVHST